MRALDFARSRGLEVAVRGGGHNPAGHCVCDGGLVIDLSLMRGVEVDADAGRRFRDAAAARRDLNCEAVLEVDDALAPVLHVAPGYTGSEADPSCGT